MPAPSSDLAACRALLKGGSRSFHAAAQLMPAAIGGPATALYAFCRLADDAVDLAGGHGPVGGKAAALARLRDRLACVYAGAPRPMPADRAFAEVVERFDIPRALPDALIEGLEWDAAGRRYATLPDLAGYAARVAGSVGAMMALIMGRRAPDIVARACDLGVAMQYTNIARDIGEDARAGRLYLPTDWLEGAGIDPEEWLARPAFGPEIAGMTARLLDEAEATYARAEPGIARLPLGCRPGIYAARTIYAGIGDQVRRNGCDSVTRRAVVPAARKAALMARAVALTMSPAMRDAAPPLPANRFLVEAVAAGSRAVPGSARPRSVGERMIWLLDLFERLERRDRCAPFDAQTPV